MKRFGGIGLKRVLAYGGLSALLLALAWFVGVFAVMMTVGLPVALSVWHINERRYSRLVPLTANQ